MLWLVFFIFGIVVLSFLAPTMIRRYLESVAGVFPNADPAALVRQAYVATLAGAAFLFLLGFIGLGQEIAKGIGQLNTPARFSVEIAFVAWVSWFVAAALRFWSTARYYIRLSPERSHLRTQPLDDALTRAAAQWPPWLAICSALFTPQDRPHVEAIRLTVRRRLLVAGCAFSVGLAGAILFVLLT